MRINMHNNSMEDSIASFDIVPGFSGQFSPLVPLSPGAGLPLHIPMHAPNSDIDACDRSLAEWQKYQCWSPGCDVTLVDFSSFCQNNGGTNNAIVWENNVTLMRNDGDGRLHKKGAMDKPAKSQMGGRAARRQIKYTGRAEEIKKPDTPEAEMKAMTVRTSLLRKFLVFLAKSHIGTSD